WQDFGNTAKDKVLGDSADKGALQDVLDTAQGLGSTGPDGLTSFERDVLGMVTEGKPFVGWDPPDPRAYVGTVRSVRIARVVDGTVTLGRWTTGVVSEFEDLGNLSSGHHVIRVVLVPSLWKLQLRRDCRIYENVTAQQIVDDVLKRAG